MSTEKFTENEFDKIIKRIMQLKNFDNEYQVAEFLGFSVTAFSQRKKRGSIPVDRLATACSTWKWNFDWVMTGEGDQPAQPQTISEQIGEGYSPEVKLLADYIEIKLKGKTAAERFEEIDGIIADLRNKYK